MTTQPRNPNMLLVEGEVANGGSASEVVDLIESLSGPRDSISKVLAKKKVTIALMRQLAAALGIARASTLKSKEAQMALSTNLGLADVTAHDWCIAIRPKLLV